MQTLKPCPFCNGEAKILRRSGTAGRVCPSKWYRERVECKVCGLTTREYKKPGSAQHSWNNRHATITNEVSTRPAAPVDGLDTVLWANRNAMKLAEKNFLWEVLVSNRENYPHYDHALVARSQAVAIIAAKDVEISRLRNILDITERNELREAENNAALTARVKELQHDLNGAKGNAKNAMSNVDYWQGQTKDLETQLAAAKKALEYVANPLKAMKEAAEKAGAKLDGSVAYSLSNDATFLKGVARAALEAKP